MKTSNCLLVLNSHRAVELKHTLCLAMESLAMERREASTVQPVENSQRQYIPSAKQIRPAKLKRMQFDLCCYMFDGQNMDVASPGCGSSW